MNIELTNDQIFAVMSLEPWWHKADSKQVFSISGAAGTGKAQPVNTLIPTPNGYKLLGDIKVGDYVFDSDGYKTKVLGVYPQGKRKVYEIFFTDGTSTRCSNEHLWRAKIGNKKDEDVCTLEELIDIINISGHKIRIPECGVITGYSKKRFIINPYRFGKFIGRYINYIHSSRFDKIVSNMCSKYEFGNINQRRNFLQGIFDNSGYCNSSKGFFIKYINNEYTDDIINCIRRISSSLAIKSFIENDTLFLVPRKNQIPYILKNNDRLIKISKYYTNICDIDYINNGYKSYKTVKSIRKHDYEEEMVCIFVDNKKHLYLTNDYIVTHNTTVIKYFIDRIGLDYNNVYFLAYMGKAVSQLQKHGLPAKTIHSAIYDYVEEYERNEDGKIIIKKNGKPKKKFSFVLKDRLPKKIKLIVVDEGSMVPEDIAYDLMSFGIPIVVLGDLNQLPPIFGESIFLKEPDVILKQIMRQKEGDPIIWLAQRILDGHTLNKGVYGNSAVIDKTELNEFNFKNANIVITGTNKLRYKINNYYRETLREIKRLEYPHIGEKVICRRNNWSESIDGIYLTNGTAGYVTDIKHDSFNHISMKMDFRPDFSDHEFKNLVFDYYHMYNMEPEIEYSSKYFYTKDHMDVFEYAYALTTHAVQGSTYSNVLFMAEDAFGDREFKKKFMYTGITRASDSITIVL